MRHTQTHLGALHVVAAFVLLYRWLAAGARLGVGHQPQTIGWVLQSFLCTWHWTQYTHAHTVTAIYTMFQKK